MWKSKGNFDCTAQRLFDQKRQIANKTLSTEDEMQPVRLQVENLL